VLYGFSNNQIETIPDGIAELSNLTELDLSSNLIYHLWDDIGKLTKLEKLFLNSNKLETIPASIQ
jgi:Leucine-rich repeat (LRR) protein